MEDLIEKVLTLLDFSEEILQKHADLRKISQWFHEFVVSELFQSGNAESGLPVIERFLKYLQIIQIALSLNSKSRKNEILKTVPKLKMLTRYITSAFALSKDDLSCLPQDHPRKIAIQAITTTVILEKFSEISKQLENFNKKFDTIKAVYYKTFKYKPSISKNLLTGWLLITLSQEKKFRFARLAEVSSEASLITKIFNVNETKLLRKKLISSLQPINFTKIIFVPKLFKSIIDQSVDLSLSDDIPTIYSLFPGVNRVAIRILSKIPISCLSPLAEAKETYDKIIIHVHGGAFIAMSTFTSQPSTRNYAIALNAFVFSIEYRLAPEYPYPAGLDDI